MEVAGRGEKCDPAQASVSKTFASSGDTRTSFPAHYQPLRNTSAFIRSTADEFLRFLLLHHVIVCKSRAK